MYYLSHMFLSSKSINDNVDDNHGDLCIGAYILIPLDICNVGEGFVQ
jgi:hypothetical protein